MSSSYSSLDWVSSHWAHFTVRRFICCVFFVFCLFVFILHACHVIVTWWNGPDGTEAKSLEPYLLSVLWHCWLGHLTHKNPSLIWPIICLVGHYTLLNPTLLCVVDVIISLSVIVLYYVSCNSVSLLFILRLFVVYSLIVAAMTCWICAD